MHLSSYYHGSVIGCNLMVNHNVKALCTINSSPLCFPWWLHVMSVAVASVLEFEAGCLFRWGFLAGSAVKKKKNLSAVQEMQAWSVSQEDPLEEEMATHSSILAWKIPWTEEPGGQQSIESHRVRHDWACMHHILSVQMTKLIQSQFLFPKMFRNLS